MSEEPYYNLIYSAMYLGDGLFELWLTITFAAILAIYFSRDQISRFMRNLLVALYTGTAVLLTGRWCVAMIHIVYYMNELSAAGLASFPTPMPFGSVMAILHFSMFAGGSIGTIYFMCSYRSSKE